MDFLGEAIALGIDSILLFVCVKHYLKNKNAVSMIQGAPLLDIDKNLNEIVNTHPNRKLSYVSVRGTVNPIGNPIVSMNNPKITGVVQSLSIKEHTIQRTSTGFWSDQERIIQEVHNIMPFVLESRGYKVEIVDPLAAEILDMDVISDVFSPTIPSVMDHIWGFFSGLRQRGIQTTERMLRKGTLITGIGELVASSDGKSLRLQPPSDGSSFYLTNMQITSLIRRFDDSRKKYRLLSILFGAIGIVITGLIVRRYWRFKAIEMENEERKRQLAESRKERRTRVRDEDLSETQLCVVCKSNPREIILLPCGHVCLCEDCAEDISDQCPLCRSIIEKKSVAYIS